MNILLQKIECDPRVVDKAPYIDTVASYSDCVARTPLSIMNPVISLECSAADAEAANYCYLESKFFFITDRTAGPNGVWTFQLRTDVLFTYRAGIRASTGIVSRNTDFYNMYIQDAKVPVMAKKIQSFQKFPSTPLTTSGGSIILITAGGI